MAQEIMNGITKNLKAQIKSYFENCNIGSYESRDRNMEACFRFADFLGETTHLQKMKNVEARHLYAYVEYVKERGLAPSTIMSDLSGIRFYFKRNGCKNALPTNDKLNLDKRETGKGGKTRVIDFEKDSKQRAIIEKWLAYAENSGKYALDYLICDKKHRDVEKAKKSMQNWLNRAKSQVVEPDREEITAAGKKPRRGTVSFHGLRHTFAQNYLTELSYMKPKDAKLKVSQTLGHERIAITKVYMSETKA